MQQNAIQTKHSRTTFWESQMTNTASPMICTTAANSSQKEKNSFGNYIIAIIALGIRSLLGAYFSE